ncbi:MAG: 4-hydroxybenzoate octaprenyltransferase [Planctomyces sp.]|nr:4-hydroxybenzoate octaprenyltransferase [Planctomyces sp.]MBA4120199.1 4-hydroxybenzoate octaprenyltransferase [Isosphaera sp.]
MPAATDTHAPQPPLTPTPDHPDASPRRPSWRASLLLAAADIKLAHSVFALPFAVLGLFLARPATHPPQHTALQLFLVVLCMITARSWAMLFNRIADARFDAANPRTARRAVASGALPLGRAVALALTCAGAFMLPAGAFWALDANPWPLALSLPVLAWLAAYSLAKRFTWLCHALLGSALAISPLAAAIAVEPAALASTPALWAIAGMVLLWVAGFDILYALQDTAFDRAAGLRSIPADLGTRAAVWISRAWHALAAASLAGACVLEPRFGPLFWSASALAAALLVAEHVVLVRRGLAGLPVAFFTLNGVFSCLLGAAGVLDLLAV